jgi:hypothetical protein
VLNAYFILLVIVFVVLDSHENLWNVNANASQSNGAIQNLYDNFDGGTYSLDSGKTSPNGKWQDLYTGYVLQV